MNSVKISEFAKNTGVSKDTIRYYEKMELLHPQMTNKHREYTVQHIEIMETIIKLKQTGFSLQEIKLLFEWSQHMDQNKKLTEEEIQNLLQIKEIFKEKYNEMMQRELQIKEIKQVLLRADNKLDWLLKNN